MMALKRKNDEVKKGKKKRRVESVCKFMIHVD